MLLYIGVSNGGSCLEKFKIEVGVGFVENGKHLFVECCQFFKSLLVRHEPSRIVVNIGDVYIQPCPAFLDLFSRCA